MTPKPAHPTPPPTGQSMAEPTPASMAEPATQSTAQPTARLTAQPATRLTTRLARLPQTVTTRVAALPPCRQMLVQDAALGFALAAVNVFSVLPYHGQLHPLPLALILLAAQGLFLAWRRVWPVPVAIAIGAARVAYDQIGFGYAPIPLGPAIALFTVMDRSGTLWRWLTVAGSATGLTVSLLAPGHHEPYDAIYQTMILLTAAIAGLLARARRATISAAESRAVRAETELDYQTAQAAMAERTRIARELHDVVAHHVSLIAVQSEAAAALIGDDGPEPVRRSVGIIGETARQALTELRRLLGVLRAPSERPETVPSASLDALGDLLNQVRGTGLPVELEVTGTPSTLAPGVDLTAYRIIQEALTNSIRHARAAQARVTLAYEPNYITVSITDSPHPHPKTSAAPEPSAAP
ncbi:MAG: histidine kinase, partial [Streptosporangiaceae bacterium]